MCYDGEEDTADNFSSLPPSVIPPTLLACCTLTGLHPWQAELEPLLTVTAGHAATSLLNTLRLKARESEGQDSSSQGKAKRNSPAQSTVPWRGSAGLSNDAGSWGWAGQDPSKQCLGQGELHKEPATPIRVLGLCFLFNWKRKFQVSCSLWRESFQ